MKITNSPSEQMMLVNESSASSAGAPESAGSPVQSQVQLLLAGQVKTLLGELSKMLEKQNAILNKLPPAMAQEAEKLLQQPLEGEETISKGLTALFKGRNTVVQNLLSFASTLDDAALLSQNLPDGIPESWNNLLKTFQNQTSKLVPDFSKKFVLLASQLLDSSETTTNPSSVLQQAGRQLVNSLPRQDLTVLQQDYFTKLPKVLKNLTDIFEQQLTNLVPQAPEKSALLATLRQTCQQFIQDLADMPPGKQPQFVGIPSLIDDMIEVIESQYGNIYSTAGKDGLIALLRQKCRQLIRNLPDDDQMLFEQLEKFMEESIPSKILEASTRHNLPELRQTWVIQRLAAGREWLSTPPEILQQASQTLREMASAVPRASSDTLPEATQGQTSLNMIIPLYFGEDKTAYPTYIHIYRDQEDQGGKADGIAPETWLRLCISTGNIGTVDMVFHIYGKNQLSIKLNFSNSAIADEFKTSIPEIRSSLDESSLNITDFSVGSQF